MFKLIYRKYSALALVSASMLFSLYPFVASQALAACQVHFHKGRNAEVSVYRYKQENARTLEEYQDALGLETEFLKKDDITLDVGAGFGCAHLKLATQFGVRANVINTQDNMGAVFELSERFLIHPVMVIAHTRGTLQRVVGVGEGSGTLSAQPIATLAESLGVQSDFFYFESETPRLLIEKAVDQGMNEIVKNIREKIESGNFNYLVGYAEDHVAKFKKSVTLLTDMWGAFSYSSQRIELLQSYYQALKPGGKAYVLSHTFKYTSTVRLKSGRIISLPQYLIEKYPSVFSVSLSKGTRTHGAEILIMTPDPNIFELKIPLKAVKIDFPKGSNFDPPSVVYEEKQQGYFHFGWP